MDDAETKPPRARSARSSPLPGEPVYRDVVSPYGLPVAAKPNHSPKQPPNTPHPNDNGSTKGSIDGLIDGGPTAGPAAEPTDRPPPDLLATLVSSAGTLAERDKALDQLWLLSARPIAEQVRSKFRHATLADFVGGSYGFLWQKLVDGKYDWRRGSFEAWWRRVLVNSATSIWRTTHNSVPFSQEHEPVSPGDRDSTEAALDQLTEQLSNLRAALDDLAPRSELRAQVNYYAVLLLELRRAVVARLRSRKLLPDLGQILPHWNGLPDSRVIETLLPWRSDEEQLVLRKDLAALGEIWGRLRHAIDAPPHDLAADHVCAQIVSTDGHSITRDVWYNWKRHVKHKLGELGFPGKWEDLF